VKASPAGTISPDTGPRRRETQSTIAGSGDPTSTDTGHGAVETQISNAGSVEPSTPPDPRTMSTPTDGPDREAYLVLRVMADSLADAMDHRIALTNRLRSGQTDPGITADIVANLDNTERLLRKAMVKAFRRASPELSQWARDTVGIGEETVARLLGRIGHPVIAQPYHWEGEGDSRTLVADPPFERTVSQLWSYCGHGDPARRRRKGMTAEEAFGLGSPDAKKLVYLLSVATMKCAGSTTTPPTAIPPSTPIPWPPSVDPLDPSGQLAADTHTSGAGGSTSPQPIALSQPTTVAAGDGTVDAIVGPQPSGVARRRSPYRDVYDQRRAHTAERDDWTAPHKNADALRIVGKHILRDMWIVTREAMDDH
jgi:hypothetical protein